GSGVPARRMTAPLRTAAVLGGGAVGQVLAAALRSAGLRIVLLWNRTEQRGWETELEGVRDAALVFLTVADSAIEPLCRRIARPLYHAAAVLAAAGQVALFSRAVTAFQDATGAPEPLARSALLPLAQGALAVLKHRDPAEALTGPVARGDAPTVAAHRKALDQ